MSKVIRNLFIFVVGLILVFSFISCAPEQEVEKIENDIIVIGGIPYPKLDPAGNPMNIDEVITITKAGRSIEVWPAGPITAADTKIQHWISWSGMSTTNVWVLHYYLDGSTWKSSGWVKKGIKSGFAHHEFSDSLTVGNSITTYAYVWDNGNSLGSWGSTQNVETLNGIKLKTEDIAIGTQDHNGKISIEVKTKCVNAYLTPNNKIEVNGAIVIYFGEGYSQYPSYTQKVFLSIPFICYNGDSSASYSDYSFNLVGSNNSSDLDGDYDKRFVEILVEEVVGNKPQSVINMVDATGIPDQSKGKTCWLRWEVKQNDANTDDKVVRPFRFTVDASSYESTTENLLFGLQVSTRDITMQTLGLELFGFAPWAPSIEDGILSGIADILGQLVGLTFGGEDHGNRFVYYTDVNNSVNIINGDFEDGSTGWTIEKVGASHHHPTISIEYNDGHNGKCAYISNTVYGGSGDRAGYIRQEITLPINATTLKYWISVGVRNYSAPVGIRINGNRVSSHYSHPGIGHPMWYIYDWEQENINISSYAGQTITLEIYMEDFGSYSGWGDHAVWIKVDDFVIE